METQVNPIAATVVDNAQQPNTNGVPGSLPGETPAQTQARLFKVMVDGQEVEITGVESAKEHGIRIIHQELMLIPDMTISENIFIGQEPISDPFCIWHCRSVADTN